MSSTGCLALAIEPTLLGVGMAPIWASIKYGGTYLEPPDIRFSALGPTEACCCYCMKKPINSCLAIFLILSSSFFL
jgi:hypothetical protein